MPSPRLAAAVSRRTGEGARTALRNAALTTRRLFQHMGRSTRLILTVLVAMVALATAASFGAHSGNAIDAMAYSAGATVDVVGSADLGEPAGDLDRADHAHDVPHVVLHAPQERDGLPQSAFLRHNPPLAASKNRRSFDRPPRVL